MPLLVVEKGHDKGKAIPVPDGGTVIIGRDYAYPATAVKSGTQAASATEK